MFGMLAIRMPGGMIMVLPRAFGGLSACYPRANRLKAEIDEQNGMAILCMSNFLSKPKEAHCRAR